MLVGQRLLGDSLVPCSDAGECPAVTLGARMSRRDEAAFVGRKREVGFLDSLFVADPPANVVLLHGPGGIGKSTLLRQVQRTGAAAGWTPVLVEGRDLPPVPDALDDALAEARQAERPLVILDSYERMTALGGYLRRAVLPELPDSTIVIIAGRRAPDPGWGEGGWESLSVELELDPLSDSESRALLAAQGVGDPRRAAELARWAEGSPLALTLAADAANLDPGWSPERQGESPELVRALIRRLAASELDAVHLDVIGVASIARVVTADLLRSVLPDIDPVEGLEWLRSRTFAEPLADGYTLHDLVRRAARADLKQRDPERERELRRRIADDLHDRAVAGNLLLTIDLAELVETPELRLFYGWEGAVRNRISAPGPSDSEQVALLLASKGLEGWWEPTRRLFEQAPERVVIARDAGDNLCGYSIAVTPANAPDVAREDVLLGRWLAHAESELDGNAILWRDAIDFTDDPQSGIQGMLNMVWVLRSGLSNPRWAYLPIDSDHARAKGFASALGAQHLSELDVRIDDTQFECHLVDYGEGGLLAMQRGVVYMELGMTPPPVTAPARAPAAAPEAPRRAKAGSEIGEEAVRDALRNLRVPPELARSPLATGDGVEERAASVRTLLEDAAAGAFGEGENEDLLRRVLTRGYLEPATSHEAAADELNLSRAAYFRRLKLASERIAEYLSGEPAR
jgi:hypothetical protein